jgi:hypothetical protein
MPRPLKEPSPFLESVRRAIQLRPYNIRAETAYVDWINRFILFNGKRHPETLVEADVAAFFELSGKRSGRSGFNTKPGAQCPDIFI